MYEFVNVLKEYFITLWRVKRKSCLEREKNPTRNKKRDFINACKTLTGKKNRKSVLILEISDFNSKNKIISSQQVYNMCVYSQVKDNCFTLCQACLMEKFDKNCIYVLVRARTLIITCLYIFEII